MYLWLITFILLPMKKLGVEMEMNSKKTLFRDFLGGSGRFVGKEVFKHSSILCGKDRPKRVLKNSSRKFNFF